MEKGKPAKRPQNGRTKQRRGGSGRPEGRPVSARKPPPARTSAGHAEKRAIHPPTRQAGLDTQAGQQRTQAAGSPGGGGSRRANGGAKCDRTHITLSGAVAGRAQRAWTNSERRSGKRPDV